MKKRIFGEVIASLESGERMDRDAANSACLRELRRNNQARGVVCTPRAWMCLNGGDAEPCPMVQDRGNRLKNTTLIPCIVGTKIV